MAKDVEVNYFEVVVKRLHETDKEDKAGNPKIEKISDKWIVHAKTSEEANEIAKSYYNGEMDEWRIASVKETQYLGILKNE